MRTFIEWQEYVQAEDITYLGCPYSHSQSKIKQERFIEICRISSILMKDDHLLFVPIAMCHPIARDWGLPGDFKFWAHIYS